MKKLLVLIPFISLCAANPQYPWGNYFRSQQGLIPNGIGECDIELDIPDPLEDGMLIELTEEDASLCRGIARWRITEFEEGRFFAAVAIPFPDSIVVDYENIGYVNNRLRDKVECREVEPYPAPIEDGHTVLKTEVCERIHVAGHTEDVKFRGVSVGAKSHFIRLPYVLSEITRWLIWLDMGDRNELAVVEDFAAENGNARWHARRYEDVDPEGCPPGDYRDVYPFWERYWDESTQDKAHADAARADYYNEDGWVLAADYHQSSFGGGGWHSGSMSVSDGGSDVQKVAVGVQQFRVRPGGERGCVAVARMEMGREILAYRVSASNLALNLGAKMGSDDPLWIRYTPYWQRSHAWVRREHDNGTSADGPNYLFRVQREMRYREKQAPNPIRVPSTCQAMASTSTVTGP